MLIRDYLREIAELQKLSTEGYVSFTPIRVFFFKTIHTHTYIIYIHMHIYIKFFFNLF